MAMGLDLLGQSYGIGEYKSNSLLSQVNMKLMDDAKELTEKAMQKNLESINTASVKMVADANAAEERRVFPGEVGYLMDMYV